MFTERVILTMLAVALSIMAMVDALVLCRHFPSCCYPYDSCHALCPSCREAKHFWNGIRLYPKYPDRLCSIGGNVINPDPYAFPRSPVYPHPPICIWWNNHSHVLHIIGRSEFSLSSGHFVMTGLSCSRMLFCSFCGTLSQRRELWRSSDQSNFQGRLAIKKHHQLVSGFFFNTPFWRISNWKSRHNN